MTSINIQEVLRSEKWQIEHILTGRVVFKGFNTRKAAIDFRSRNGIDNRVWFVTNYWEDAQ